ncbi:MAG: hypothetical protein ACYCQI_11700 [Gammaproteobacteria bacterium]
MLRMKKLLTPDAAKPTTSEKKESKSDQKETTVNKQESKDTSILAPIKKAAGGLAAKFAQLGPKTLTSFQSDVVDALNAIKNDKAAQNVEKAKAGTLIYRIKVLQNTDADIEKELNLAMNELKTEKKNYIFTDLSHYELFAKHVNPVLEKHKSSLESSAVPVKKKAL